MEFVIMGSLAIFYGYHMYRSYNPTIEDLIEKKRQNERRMAYNASIAAQMDKENEWEERCLAAGMILPY
jgi:hypothetical protein